MSGTHATRAAKHEASAKIYERVDHMYISINDYMPRLMFDVSRITEGNGAAYRDAAVAEICEKVELWTSEVFVRLRIMFGDVKDTIAAGIAQTRADITALFAKYASNCAGTFEMARLMLFDLLTHAHVEMTQRIVQLTDQMEAR